MFQGPEGLRATVDLLQRMRCGEAGRREREREKNVRMCVHTCVRAHVCNHVCRGVGSDKPKRWERKMRSSVRRLRGS